MENSQNIRDKWKTARQPETSGKPPNNQKHLKKATHQRHMEIERSLEKFGKQQ